MPLYLIDRNKNMQLSGQESFPKSSRLRKRPEFRELMDKGRKAVGPYMLVFADFSASPKLGLVASRRVGCAVERNRIKRRLREIYRRSSHVGDMGRLVIVARRAANQVSTERLEASLLRALRFLRKGRDLSR